MEEPKLRDSKKAGMLTFSELKAAREVGRGGQLIAQKSYLKVEDR